MKKLRNTPNDVPQRRMTLPTIMTSYTSNFGPLQHPVKPIPLVIFDALRGDPIPIYGDGGSLSE